MKIKNVIALILLVVAATTFIKKADIPVPSTPAVIPISPEWQVKVAEIRNIANQHSKASILVGKFYADFADVLNRDNEVITYGKLREVHKRAQSLYAQKTPLVNSIPGISAAIDNVLIATFGLDDVAIDRAKVTNCFVAISWACGHNPQLVNSPSIFSETGPPSIKELYESGFKGVVPNPEAEKRFDEIMEWPNGGKVYHKFNIEGNGEGKLSIPFIYVDKLFPGCWPASAQARGDCTKMDTMVKMADGTEKRIIDVKIGDYVISHLGNIRKVIDFIEKDYDGEMISLEVDGYKRIIEMTPDHLFVEFDNPQTSDSTKWTSVETFEKSNLEHYLLLPRFDLTSIEQVIYDLGDSYNSVTEDTKPRSHLSRGEISDRMLRPSKGYIRTKGSNNQCKRFINYDEKLAWLLGLYLAEGSMDYSPENGSPKRITLNLGSHEQHLAEKAKRYFKEIFDVDSIITQVPSKPTVLYVRCNSQPISWLFNKLAPGNVYTKEIHYDIFKCPINVRMSLIRGWLDGDGSLEVEKVCRNVGASVSKNLILQLFDLANSCNLRCTLTEAFRLQNRKQAYYLNFYGDNVLQLFPEEKNECKINVKINDFRIKKFGLAAKIKKIEKTYHKGKVYCIGVEKDHSFIANGYAVHNCVSHSTRNAVLTTLSTDIISGKPDEKSGFVETVPDLPKEGIADGVLSTEAIYWWRRHGGDGWNCSDAAIVVCKESGLWLRKDYPEFGFNLTRYSASLAGKWGSNTPPSNIFSFGQQHLVHTSTRLTTAEQIRDFLANGYGLSSCGSEGFSDSRDENGVSGRSGSWSHAMAYIGYDDRPEIKKIYGEPLVLILNSWGKWNKGPRVIYGTNISIPEGSFWTKYSNVRNRSVYAFSGVNGWPQKRLPDYGTFIWG